VVSWFVLGAESIADSYGWVENLFSATSLVDMTLLQISVHEHFLMECFFVLLMR
jgi:hypothetical protein